jgi:hypothetical protein
MADGITGWSGPAKCAVRGPLRGTAIRVEASAERADRRLDRKEPGPLTGTGFTLLGLPGRVMPVSASGRKDRDGGSRGAYRYPDKLPCRALGPEQRIAPEHGAGLFSKNEKRGLNCSEVQGLVEGRRVSVATSPELPGRSDVELAHARLLNHLYCSIIMVADRSQYGAEGSDSLRR